MADERQAQRHLVHEAYESLLARWAKYNDPRNEDWDREYMDRFEKHAINAALDLRDCYSELSALRARVIALEEGLRERQVKGHHDTCSSALIAGFVCDCGYDNANRLLAEGGKGGQ